MGKLGETTESSQHGKMVEGEKGQRDGKETEGRKERSVTLLNPEPGISSWLQLEEHH